MRFSLVAKMGKKSKIPKFMYCAYMVFPSGQLGALYFPSIQEKNEYVGLCVDLCKSEFREKASIHVLIGKGLPVKLELTKPSHEVEDYMMNKPDLWTKCNNRVHASLYLNKFVIHIPGLQVKMHNVSYIHFFYLGLCLLTLTSSAAAGPETLCGAELVDALQFVCGDRGFYFIPPLIQGNTERVQNHFKDNHIP
ncbi:Igf1 [Columba guinea]|nr:Igf1 [Columba guinea]